MINHNCITDLPQSTSLSNPEGHNSPWFLSSSVPSTSVLYGGAMGELVMTDPSHHYRRPWLNNLAVI